MPAYLSGYDIGSSSVNAALVDAQTGRLVASVSSPDQEMKILSPRPDWGERNPDDWWRELVEATAGTSGVIYGITGEPSSDRKGRINTFVHVNSQPQDRHLGVVVCVNGIGILNSWVSMLPLMRPLLRWNGLA